MLDILSHHGNVCKNYTVIQSHLSQNGYQQNTNVGMNPGEKWLLYMFGANIKKYRHYGNHYGGF